MPESRLAALSAKLENGGQKTRQALQSLTAEQWQCIVYETPYPWTVRAVLAHFVSAEVWLLRLAQDVASGGSGVPEGFDYDALNAQEQHRLADQSPQALLEALAGARQTTLEWVRGLEEEKLDRVGRHPALGEVSLEAMLTAIYGHQLLHMRDVKHALSTPDSHK